MSKRQETFNKIVAAMTAQNWERSIGPGGTCAYRSEDGKKCAIGVLMTDWEAHTCDDIGAGALNLPFPIEDRLVSDTGLNPNELAAIQRAHDRGNTPVDMRVRFVDVARNLGLEFIEQ